jgi:hypothetical protein
LVKLAPASVEYWLRYLKCVRRSLIECLFHPNTTWKKLSEQAWNDALAKLDAMKASEFNGEHCQAWQRKIAFESICSFAG